MSGKRSRAFRAYQKVKALRPARSLFDLSHDVLMTADMFKLYPVCAMEMSPGDTFHIWNESVTRMQPLNAPILSEIKQNTHYFFVPYRILWEYWTEFITGGSDGSKGGSSIGLADSNKDHLVDAGDATPSIPLWEPVKTGVGSLWDYFGLPVGINYPAGDTNKMCPVDFLRRAYNMIWNEYYRDENLQAEVSLDNEDILYRNWKKDYFTSALLNQQRGVSPLMPVNVSAEIQLSEAACVLQSYSLSGLTFLNMDLHDRVEFSPTTNIVTCTWRDTATGDTYNVQYSFWRKRYENGIYYLDYIPTQSHPELAGLDLVYVSNDPSFVHLDTIKKGVSSVSAGFDVKDLRQAFQIQKWLELANRGGVRYTEFLRSFFGVSPRDDRLQRPEYIGGSSSNVVVSEVLQTNASVAGSTPLAYMAGHGLGAERTYIGSYSASEYGILIGLMSYTTPPVYAQGINRQWLRRTKFDFLFPQFTGLSEQAILGAEIYATGISQQDRRVWGFNEIYDELRAMTSKVVGKMRSVFSYWHLARIFGTKPALNEDFISGKDVSKRIFAVPAEDGFIVHYANIIRALRPLPKYGTPKGV